MNQSLSCTVVLLESLERRRTVYLDMFDILKKLFILHIFKRNMSCKQVSSVHYQSRCFRDLLSIQWKMLWFPSRTNQVPLRFRFLCFYGYVNYVVNRWLCMLKTFCHFRVINITCLTNEEKIKFWQQNFTSLTNKNKLKHIQIFVIKNLRRIYIYVKIYIYMYIYIYIYVYIYI